MKESTKKLLILISLQNGDIGILAGAILELELHREKAMTPTEQDKELREKISHRFDSVCTEGHQQSCGEYQVAVDDIMQLITADRKRVALEARIDELTKLRRMFERLAEYAGDKEQVMSEYDERIAEIKAQREV